MAMRIGIIGAGAIGSVVGGLLTRAGHDVTLIDQWPEHVEAMRTRGPPALGDLRRAPDAGARRSTCTSCSSRRAVRRGVRRREVLRHRVGDGARPPYLRKPDGVVVDFQNGINDERVAAVAGRERTLGCVITIGAGMYEPGPRDAHRHGSVGFKIGEHDGKDTPRARELAERHERRGADQGDDQSLGRALVEARRQLHGQSARRPHRPRLGRGAHACRRPQPHRPSIVAAEAIRGRPRARLRGGADLRHRRPALRGRRRGARARSRSTRTWRRAPRSLAGGRPSLLQDVMQRRRTEIDYLNGYVCERGRDGRRADPGQRQASSSRVSGATASAPSSPIRRTSSRFWRSCRGKPCGAAGRFAPPLRRVARVRLAGASPRPARRIAACRACETARAPWLRRGARPRACRTPGRARPGSANSARPAGASRAPPR